MHKLLFLRKIAHSEKLWDRDVMYITTSRT